MKAFIGKNEKGVSLVEIMIVVAIMGVLFIGLFTLINKVTRGTWSLSSALGLGSDAAEAMYWIGNDFRNAKASTMGGQLVDPALGIQAQNPGFEIPLGLGNNPVKWEDMAVNNVAKIAAGWDMVRSGFLAIGLPNGTSYYSQVSTTTYTAREYVMSAWAKNQSKGFSECRLLTDAGADFVPAVFISTTTSSDDSYWMHLTTTTTKPTNTAFKFRLRHPWGENWFKAMHEPVASGIKYCYQESLKLGVYKGFMYAAMYPANVYRRYNGAQWTDIPLTGFTLAASEIPHYMAPLSLGQGVEYNNRIYAFRDFQPAGASFEMWGFNGDTWNFVNKTAFFQGTASDFPSEVFCYEVYKGCLYAGGSFKRVEWPVGSGGHYNTPCIWRFDGVSWTTPYNDLTAFNIVADLCTFNNRLYATMDYLNIGGLLYSDDGITWQPDAAFMAAASAPVGGGSFNVSVMCVYNNRIYVGVRYSPILYPGVNTRLFFFDGVSWQAGPLLNEAGDFITALQVYNNKLYITTGEFGTQSAVIGGKIYVYNGVSCLEDYSLVGANKTIYSFATYNGLLYANYEITGETGILQLGGYSLFDDISVSPKQVIFSSSTAVSTDTDYEYYTSKGVSDNEISRFKRYRLHYDRPSRKLYRQVYNGPGVNDWVDESPAPLSENVSKLTITNINQESFEVELILEKYDAAGNKKAYKMNSKFTPAVP